MGKEKIIYFFDSFYIFYESGIKFFLKWFINKCLKRHPLIKLLNETLVNIMTFECDTHRDYTINETNPFSCFMILVRTKCKTSGPYITWALNLFVVGLRISYFGSFSAERLKATLSLFFLTWLFSLSFSEPLLLPNFFYL